MAIMELVYLGISSVLMVVLSKTRLHLRGSCASCSYNEHNVDISSLNEERADCVSEDDLPMDSFQTLPPPPAPVFRSAAKHPLPACYDLRRIK